MRLIKLSADENHAQDAPHIVINRRRGYFPRRYFRKHLLRNQPAAAIARGLRLWFFQPVLHGLAAGHFQIHAGIHRSCRAVSAAPVRHYEPFKAPLFLQHIFQQERVFRAVHAVQLVIGGHHRPDAGFLNRRFERWKINFVQGALAHHRINSMSFELLIVRGKMLDRRNHAFPLHSLDVSHRQAPREIGIFAVPLEISFPQRRTVNVHRRTQNHISSQSFHFLSNRLPLVSQQIGIPGRGHRHSRRKGSRGHFVPALLISLGRRSSPRPYSNRPIGHFYGGDAEPFIGHALHPIGSAQHGNFFLQRHPPQQILNPLLRRQAGVFIRWDLRTAWVLGNAEYRRK